MWLPTNLSVFIGAIFLSNGVNVFTTIYAVPGKPVHSLGLWCSAITSVASAGFWTVLAAKKDVIEKAVLSSPGELEQRNGLRTQMWESVWHQVFGYLFGAIVLSALAMVVLVVPP